MNLLFAWIFAFVAAVDLPLRERDINQPNPGGIFSDTLKHRHPSRTPTEAPGQSATQSDSGNSLPAFDFVLRCGTTQELCTKMERSMSRAIEVFNRHLRVQRQIVIFVDVLLDVPDLFAASHPSRQLTLRPEHILPSKWAFYDPDYKYPSALAKQLVRNTVQIDNTYDFTIDVNSGWAKVFWFPEDGPIRQNQVDFQGLMQHEIVHGLGFITQWGLFELSPLRFDGMVVPVIATLRSVFGISRYFDKLSIFDKFIRISETKEPLSKFYEYLRHARLTERQQELPWLQNFYLSAKKTAENLFHLSVTPETLEFAFPDDRRLCYGGKNIVLHTRETKFRPGTSLIHVDDKLYRDDPQVSLMTPFMHRGVIHSGRIGDGILAILEVLGYDVVYDRDSPCHPDKTIYDEDEVNEEDSYESNTESSDSENEENYDENSRSDLQMNKRTHTPDMSSEKEKRRKFSDQDKQPDEEPDPVIMRRIYESFRNS